MDIKQIRSFLAVAETGSVTRAAQMLHVVQPAVSRQLKVLEDELGVPLFDRDRQGMLLTDAGRTFAERAGRALAELDSARLEVRPARGALIGSVGIGLLPSSCDLLAAPLAMAVRSKHPGIQITFTVGFTDHLSRWLEEGEIDAALLYDPPASSKLSSTPLLLEPLCVCGIPAFGLDADDPLPIEVLGDHPLVIPSRKHGLRALVDRTCAQSQVRMTVAAETNAQAVHKALVIQGMGLGVMPRVAIRDELKSGLLTAALIDHPSFVRTIALALPTTRKTSPAARFVTTALNECVASCVASGAWLDATLLGPESITFESADEDIPE
ncbi:LysR family transcriptional regulator [Variovorax saccharolyticus]|uniref:LysR family transcriptional regulator n=1 Tax=Variovorax saccharolyticus TaxID=3053516 RepID=UPI002575A257|nr:LysR family transcriptional regulator [Variovorax sp. J31P216]MDM0028354.1 LysR family transcriptional regulator [Variovorax sp. J31P216]